MVATKLGTSDAKSPEAMARIRKLLSAKIEFIGNSEFIDMEFEEHQWPAHDPLLEMTKSESADEQDSDGCSYRFLSVTGHQILTAEQEQCLFREMNHLKFQADYLRGQLDADDINFDIVDRIEQLLDAAQTIRNHIIQCNMRLVVSIVKKFASPQQTVEDLISQETLTLMNAVEKFDFARGFRFSTYAYRSIIRNAYRSVTNARQEGIHFVGEASEWTFEQEDGGASSLDERAWDNLRDTASSMVSRLDRRERFIVRSRYALGSHRRVRTFQYLADKLGISKERTRQIEKRAVNKLREMSSMLEIDELTGATIA